MTINYEVIPASDMTSGFIKKTNEDGSVTFIPTDPANSDYQAYLASLQAPTAQ